MGWTLLNLVGGGILSVLPLPVWPYEPAQTPAHYAMHLLYGMAQFPLIMLLTGWIRGKDAAPTDQRPEKIKEAQKRTRPEGKA